VQVASFPFTHEVWPAEHALVQQLPPLHAPFVQLVLADW
jgi:hypothetical protein